MDGHFIRLTTPVSYPSEISGEVLPSLTHWQVCKFEMEFRSTGTPPYVIVYLGLVYFSNNVKYKPPVPGRVFRFEGSDYDNFANSETGTLQVHADLEKELCDYLVESSLVNGIVEKVEGFT